MARRLAKLAPEAAEWLKDEIRYLAKRSVPAAERLVRRIRQARINLEDHPKFGPPGMIPTTRRLVVDAYVLTVRQRNGAVEIVAIRNARQEDAYAPSEILEEGNYDEENCGNGPV